MIRTLTFILFLLFYLGINAQDKEQLNWQKDLEVIKNNILKQGYLFHHVSKKDFLLEIDNFKKDTLKFNKQLFFWKIKKLLGKFKDNNLFITNRKPASIFPFAIKHFKNGFFITNITRENKHLLGKKIIKINNVSIKNVEAKLIKNFYLPHQNIVDKFIENNINNKTLLNYLDIVKTDTITLEFNNNKTKLVYNANFDKDFLVVLKPKKAMLNQKKDNNWFWTYGINFGQQVFLKLQVCASNEHIIKMKDSINMTNIEYAKTFDLSLQSVINAPKVDPFITKIVDKFKKRRYKKIIIDLRNNTKGSLLSTKKLRCKLDKVRRLHKKNRFYILANKYTNNAAIGAILALKNKFKVVLISETIFGSKQDTNTSSSFTLLHSNFTINYPLQYYKDVTIEPTFLVQPTINHYKNGIDVLLQKVLDN